MGPTPCDRLRGHPWAVLRPQRTFPHRRLSTRITLGLPGRLRGPRVQLSRDPGVVALLEVEVEWSHHSAQRQPREQAGDCYVRLLGGDHAQVGQLQRVEVVHGPLRLHERWCARRRTHPLSARGTQSAAVNSGPDAHFGPQGGDTSVGSSMRRDVVGP